MLSSALVPRSALVSGCGAVVGVGAAGVGVLLASSRRRVAFCWCRSRGDVVGVGAPVAVVSLALCPSALRRFALLLPLLASLPSPWVPLFVGAVVRGVGVGTGTAVGGGVAGCGAAAGVGAVLGVGPAAGVVPVVVGAALFVGGVVSRWFPCGRWCPWRRWWRW